MQDYQEANDVGGGAFTTSIIEAVEDLSNGVAGQAGGGRLLAREKGGWTWRQENAWETLSAKAKKTQVISDRTRDISLLPSLLTQLCWSFRKAFPHATQRRTAEPEGRS